MNLNIIFYNVSDKCMDSYINIYIYILKVMVKKYNYSYSKIFE